MGLFDFNLFDERSTFERLYDAASAPGDLPWHRDEPWPMLERVVHDRGEGGRAVDLGCGAGIYSVYLAEQGYDVTGVDLMPEAVEMAADRADAAGVDLTLSEADILQWRGDGPYDLVLDASCMHSFTGVDRDAYHRRLLHDWLADDGDYVLVHFGKKHLLDWRPMGPRRRTRAEVVDEFSPPLVETAYAEDELTGVPLPVGPRPRMGQYWFQRPGRG